MKLVIIKFVKRPELPADNNAFFRHVAHDVALPVDAPRLWAEQSCRLAAAAGFYPRGHVIDQAYANAHLPLAERQLRLAGERLAAVLNAALGQSSAD